MIAGHPLWNRWSTIIVYFCLGLLPIQYWIKSLPFYRRRRSKQIQGWPLWIAKKREVIAGILYDQSEDGIWVNWLAVLNGIYEPKLFGEAANRSPFHSIGIGTLLLSMIQLESAALGWKTDIFLQVNGNEPSVHFYQSNGARIIFLFSVITSAER